MAWTLRWHPTGGGGVLPQDVKPTNREADHSAQSSAEVCNAPSVAPLTFLVDPAYTLVKSLFSFILKIEQTRLLTG
jgi:hypothetical protein